MMKLKEWAKKLKEDIPAVYLCLKDRRTPFLAKMIATLCIGYALSPVDLIPDFIPVLGYLDDLLILPLLVYLTCRLIPDDVWQSKRVEAKDLWKDGKPKKWYYSLPIILLWVCLLWALLRKPITRLMSHK